MWLLSGTMPGTRASPATILHPLRQRCGGTMTGEAASRPLSMIGRKCASRRASKLKIGTPLGLTLYVAFVCGHAGWAAMRASRTSAVWMIYPFKSQWGQRSGQRPKAGISSNPGILFTGLVLSPVYARAPYQQPFLPFRHRL